MTFHVKLLAAALAAGLALPAAAADCPAERPIKRPVVDWTKPLMCTAMLCTGQLSCPPGGGPCTIAPADNCNRCGAPEVVDGCFTEQEIRDATKR